MRIRSDKNEPMDKAFRKIYAMYRSGHSIREIIEACNYLPEIYVIDTTQKIFAQDMMKRS